MLVRIASAEATEAAANSSGTPGWMVGAAILAALLWVGRGRVRRWFRGRLRRASTEGQRHGSELTTYLAPLGSGLGLLALLAVLHQADPGLWLWPVIGGAGLAVLAMFRKQATETAKLIQQAKGAALAAYGAWVVAQGMSGGALLAGLLLVLAAAVPSWVDGRTSGSARLMARLQQDRWSEITEARGLKGLKRGRITKTAAGLDVVLTLGGGLELSTLNAKLTSLETGLGVRRGAIRFDAHDMSHKVTMRVILRDPLKKPTPWPGHDAGTCVVPAVLGLTPHGEQVEINLRQRLLIAGTTGAGKSVLCRVLGAAVVQSEDAELVYLDLKQGAESQHWEDVADCVDTPKGAVAKIREIRARMDERLRAMKAKRQSEHVPTPDEPDVFVLVDEGSELIRQLDDEAMGDLYAVAEQGRAPGFHLWWATQYPIGRNIPTEISTQLNGQIGLRVENKRISDVVFGQGASRDGWHAHRLRGKGWFLVKDIDHAEPEPARGFWISEADVRKLRRPATAVRVPIDAEPETVAVVPPPRPEHAPTVPVRAPEPVPADEPEFGAVSVPESAVPVLASGGTLRERIEGLRAALAEAEAQAQAQAEESPAPDPSIAEAPADIHTALAEAPESGASVPELAARLGLAKSRVYELLRAAVEEGRAVKVGRGRYIPADGTSKGSEAEKVSEETA